MALASIEFQISAAKFASAILSTLRNSPRCPPGAVQGLQLQRVRFRSAATRNSKIASFQIFQEMGAWDQGLGYDWIRSRVAQLAVDVTLDITTTAQIAAHPNGLPPLVAQPQATIVLDLECRSRGRGRVAISYTVTAIEASALPDVEGVPIVEWARAQLTALLDLQPVVIDLQGAIAPGMQFWNAGIAADATGTRLVIRAEVRAPSSVYTRWQTFYDGSIPDRLGSHDWSLFLRAEDLKLALTTPVWQALREGLGNKAHWLITVGASFSAQPGYAVITLTPFIDLPVLGVTPLPIAITFSVDAASGRLVVEIDAHGVRELIDDLKRIAYIVINLTMPIVGWFLSAALIDAIGDAVNTASAAAGAGLGDALGGLDGVPDGTTFEEIPGWPFRYRATVPVAVPPFVEGAFEALIATPDGMALAGRWRVRNFVEGEMTVEASEFGWQAPTVACGADGERVLHAFEANARQYATLYAQVNMTRSGTAPARLCSVSLLNALGAATGLQIVHQASDLPTRITLTAPSSYADMMPAPVLLEVRTTYGVFHAFIPHPRPMTEQDVTLMRSRIVTQLRLCDAIVLPAWFKGFDKFDLSWIVDPLHDPDYGHSWVSLTELHVAGLAAGTSLHLVGADDLAIARVPANADGTALLAAALTPGMRGLHAVVRGTDAQGPTEVTSRTGSVTVKRELLEARGSLQLPMPAHALFAAPAQAPGSFFAALDDSLVFVDAAMPTRPVLGDAWDIPGARGVVWTTRGTLVFGDAGLVVADRGGRMVVVDREPVLDAAELLGGVAILTRGRLSFMDRHGTTIAEERVDEDVAALMAQGPQLRIFSSDRIDTIETVHARPARRLESVRGPGVIPLVRSSIDGRVSVRVKIVVA